MSTRASRRKVLKRNNKISSNSVKKLKLEETVPTTEDELKDQDTGKCNKNIKQSKKTPVYKSSNSERKSTETDSIYEFDDVNEDKNKSTDEHRCKKCDQFFDNAVELEEHSRQCHQRITKIIMSPAQIEQYFNNADRSVCPICQKSLKIQNVRSEFIKHLLTHTRSLTHECKVCNMKFTRKDHMKAHEKRHIVSV